MSRTPLKPLADDAPEHGTFEGYVHWRCRCGSCSAAATNPFLSKADRTRVVRANYYLKNLDKIKIKQQKHRDENSEKLNATTRMWYKKNAELARVYRREYYIKNRDNSVFKETAARNGKTWRQSEKGKTAEKNRRLERREWAAAGTAERASVRAVIQAADGICCYCRRNVGKDNLEIEHVVPKSLGGRHDVDNLAAACGECNHGQDGKWTKNPWVWLAKMGYEPPNVPALHRYPKPAEVTKD